MKPLPVDDLPQYSEWAAYLLDPVGEPPEEPGRYADASYYEELGAKLLEAYRADPVGAEALYRNGTAHGRSEPDVVSIDGELFLATTDELIERERAIVVDALDPVLGSGTNDDGEAPVGSAETVVDLGCGWGPTLGWIADAFPQTTAIGGEYSAASVEVGRDVYAERDRVSIEQFDFREAWTPLDAAAGDAVVFTRGALTTGDDVASVVDRLAERATAGDVVGGVHLEQVDAHPDTVLGHLRRHYSRVRGYDETLLETLEAHDDLAVTTVAYDVLGPNPLHPHTLVRWRGDPNGTPH